MCLGMVFDFEHRVVRNTASEAVKIFFRVFHNSRLIKGILHVIRKEKQ